VLSRYQGAAATAYRVVLFRRLILAIPASAFLGTGYVLAGRPLAWEVAWFACSMVATCVYSTAAVVFRNEGRTWIESSNEVISRIFVLTIGTAWLKHGGGVGGVAATYALADLCSALVLGSLGWRAVEGKDGDVPWGALSVRRAGGAALAQAVGVVYYRIDSWLIAVLLRPPDVAHYAVAYKVFEVLLLPAGAIASMSVPWVGSLQPRLARARLLRLAGVGALVSGAVGAAMVIAAHWAIGIVFGPGYDGSVGALRWLVALMPATALVMILLPSVTLARTARAVILQVGLLVSNVGLNLVLIPRLGIRGAAIATGICQLGALAPLLQWTRAEVLGKWLSPTRSPASAGGPPGPTPPFPAQP
jgi:O-antigen/teichoic acid export membrane protein